MGFSSVFCSSWLLFLHIFLHCYKIKFQFLISFMACYNARISTGYFFYIFQLQLSLVLSDFLNLLLSVMYKLLFGKFEPIYPECLFYYPFLLWLMSWHFVSWQFWKFWLIAIQIEWKVIDTICASIWYYIPPKKIFFNFCSQNKNTNKNRQTLI